MKEKNIFKILVPIVAVVVIFESVMVISNLSKNKTKLQTVQPTPSPVIEVEKKVEETMIEAVFATDTSEMKIGKAYKVELNLLGRSDFSLDAIDLYVKFDKSAFDVSNLTFGSRLPKPTFNKVSTLKSLIVVNFLVNERGGLRIGAEEVVPVIKFEVKPKKAGTFDFEINRGDEGKESVTLFVQSGTSKVLPFSSNKLTVNVSR